jgi:hypothetical protein
MTIVLKVVVNGEQFTLAGEASMGVLSAHVTALGRLGPESQSNRRSPSDDPDIDLSVGGLTGRGDRRKDEHLRWGTRLSLKPGDKVEITVLDSDTFDLPTSRYPAKSNASYGAAARKRWFEARSLYFRFKDKFGGQAEKETSRFKRHVIKSRL